MEKMLCSACGEGSGEQWGPGGGERRSFLPWNRLSALAPRLKLPWITGGRGSTGRVSQPFRVPDWGLSRTGGGFGLCPCTVRLDPADVFCSYSRIFLFFFFIWSFGLGFHQKTGHFQPFFSPLFPPRPCFPLAVPVPGSIRVWSFFNFLSRHFHLSLQIIFNKGLAWSNLFSVSSLDLK